MQIELDKSELKTIIKCLIAFKMIAMLFKLDYKPIKELLKKLHGYNDNKNVFKD